MTRGGVLVLGLAMLALISCGGTDEPVLGTTTSGVAPLDPGQRLRELGTTYRVGGLRSCSPPRLDEARCAEELVGAGRAVEKLREAVTADETVAATRYQKIVVVADDFLRAVNVMIKGGCYGLGPPSAVEESLSLCGDLAALAVLTWMELEAVASGR
ncbi:hypothetical protein [Saccharothrix obliqua]|uniref:hypothetical protein n=1 Tax=Saccharothrix obliqua TaxID=2861747 RepID=UPI001C600659|nr:hypothetical protein [Saccharothrix obliqua]MBW4721589.1 hypothetical protein [Saccharothrix obliqua]